VLNDCVCEAPEESQDCSRGYLDLVNTKQTLSVDHYRRVLFSQMAAGGHILVLRVCLQTLRRGFCFDFV
jgi:hypothetical protein